MSGFKACAASHAPAAHPSERRHSPPCESPPGHSAAHTTQRHPTPHSRPGASQPPTRPPTHHALEVHNDLLPALLHGHARRVARGRCIHAAHHGCGQGGQGRRGEGSGGRGRAGWGAPAGKGSRAWEGSRRHRQRGRQRARRGPSRRRGPSSDRSRPSRRNRHTRDSGHAPSMHNACTAGAAQRTRDRGHVLPAHRVRDVRLGGSGGWASRWDRVGQVPGDARNSGGPQVEACIPSSKQSSTLWTQAALRTSWA